MHHIGAQHDANESMGFATEISHDLQSSGIGMAVSARDVYEDGGPVGDVQLYSSVSMSAVQCRFDRRRLAASADRAVSKSGPTQAQNMRWDSGTG